jgi:hypothetical protein
MGGFRAMKASIEQRDAANARPSFLLYDVVRFQIIVCVILREVAPKRNY